jgi:hypothetical protein
MFGLLLSQGRSNVRGFFDVSNRDLCFYQMMIITLNAKGVVEKQ